MPEFSIEIIGQELADEYLKQAIVDTEPYDSLDRDFDSEDGGFLAKVFASHILMDALGESLKQMNRSAKTLGRPDGLFTGDQAGLYEARMQLANSLAHMGDLVAATAKVSYKLTVASGDTPAGQ